MPLDTSVRKYGKPLYRIAVLHGGPGAPGYMAPVARELSELVGVLEPLQTRDSLQGQIEELENQLTLYAVEPLTLIGSSWGAVLALFFAARKPSLAGKLILIGSAVFDAENSARIEPLRIARLSREKQQRYYEIMKEMEQAPQNSRNALMREWGILLDETDKFDPITGDLEIIDIQYDIYSKVWPEFEALRDQPGFLKKEFSKIKAPVVVVHGEYDPHPIEGIRPFLENCLEDVTFYILPECGHYPWIEKRAKKRFFEILRSEL